TDECGFGLVGAPRFRADATEGDACPRDVLIGDGDHDSRGSQGELVRRPVAQFQIHLLAARDRCGKRHMRDEVARLKHCFAVGRKYMHRVRWSRLPAVVAMLRSWADAPARRACESTA